jgi:DNA polymerase-3 subunit alpha
VRERLTLEKAAIGFYLSGHLFDEHAAEVRRLQPKQLSEVADSREPQLLAGIVGDLRVINGQRGRVCIFKLDDGSEALEVVLNDELYETHKALLTEDNLVFVQANVRNDRFSGGLRAQGAQVWDLAGVRSRYAKALEIDLPRPSSQQVQLVKDWVGRYPAQELATDDGETLRRGLPIRWPLRLAGVEAVAELGASSLHWPSDAALSDLRDRGVGAQWVYR